MVRSKDELTRLRAITDDQLIDDVFHFLAVLPYDADEKHTIIEEVRDHLVESWFIARWTMQHDFFLVGHFVDLQQLFRRRNIRVIANNTDTIESSLSS